MIIKNTTDKATPKVVGIGSYWIQPGEERNVPDVLVYVDEVDEFGSNTGKKIVLPALMRQKEMGMIDFVVNKANKPAEKPAEIVPEPVVEDKKTDEVAPVRDSEDDNIDEIVETAKKTRTRRSSRTINE